MTIPDPTHIICGSRMPQEYLPESWSMRKDSIYAAQEAIRAGIENTQELLIEHDASLGRTTRKNRCIAERLEAEIRQMQAALNGLQTPNGCPYGENSSIATESAIDDKPPRNEA